MASIGSNPGFDRAGLGPHGDRRVLDDLQQQGRSGEVRADEARLPEPERAPVAALDGGELALRVAAWEGTPTGQRLLPGEAAFERELGGLDLSLAADRGARAVLDALG